MERLIDRNGRTGKDVRSSTQGHQPMTDARCNSARKAGLPDSPEEAQLDRVPNPHQDTDYVARFTAPEFTSLCPVTGQPDFAHLVIDYVPGRWLVESKSLKLYLAQLPQSRRLPRGLHGRHRQAPCRIARAALSAHRRILVSARRHSHRRLLADRRDAKEPLAARPGRCSLSGASAERGGAGPMRRRQRRRR